MAKGKLKIGLDKFIDQTKKTINKALSKAELTKVGDFVSDMIRIRTRLGYGVAGAGQSRTRLKELSPVTKLIRARFKQLSDETTPKRSNLTFTGQLLESLGIKEVGSGKIIIGPKGRRRGESQSNEDVAKKVDREGRPFLHLTDLEIKKLNRFFQNNFTDIVKRELTK